VTHFANLTAQTNKKKIGTGKQSGHLNRVDRRGREGIEVQADGKGHHAVYQNINMLRTKPRSKKDQPIVRDE